MLAPDFTLPDQDGKLHNRSDYLGTWLIVYFYPKDNTPECTGEACSFRDSFHKLEAKGVGIVGISRDSIASHKAFAQKNSLNFPILSDSTAEICIAYNAWWGRRILGLTFGLPLRSSFLISPDGEIVKIYEKVDPVNHAMHILNDLDAIDLIVVPNESV